MRATAYAFVSVFLGAAAACSGNSKTTPGGAAGHAGTTSDAPGGTSTGGNAGSSSDGGNRTTGGVGGSSGSQSTGGKSSTAGTPSTAGTTTMDGGEAGAPNSAGTPSLGGTSAGTSGSAQGGTPSTSGTSSGTAGSAGAPCGNYDEPCCAPNTCTHPDSYCEQDGPNGPTCVQCGIPGAVCCDGNKGLAPRCASGCCVVRGRSAVCFEEGDACPGGGACEADGTCGTCGGPGEDCCQEFPEEPVWVSWCAAHARCERDEVTQATACEACGQPGEICCYDPEDAFGGDYCDPGSSCIRSEDSGPNLCAKPR